MKEEKILKGIAISEGIAIGVVFFLQVEERKIPEFSIASHEVDREIARYRNALFSSREDLKQIKNHLEEDSLGDSQAIIDSHICMLDDPLLTEQTEARIRCRLQNPESVFQSVINDYGQRFSKKTDPFFQERLVDVKDLAQRVLSHLCPSKGKSLLQVPFNSVVFAKELIPSQIAPASASRVSAFVTASRGGHSHAALIARAKGIPYVGGIDIEPWINASIHCVIVDGQSGEVILNPTPQTVETYRLRKTRAKISFHRLQKESAYDVETRDGYPVSVYANIGHPDEWEQAKESHPKGIGLFRSEYLFLQRRQLASSEEEQYEVYSGLARSMQGLPVVIRVFDIGGDKTPQWMVEEEANPVLGCRGIRFLLRHPELLKTQIRAILRAAVHGDIRILLPLISDRVEVDAFKRYRDEVIASLSQEGISYKALVPLGCMIELPSAVLLCDILAKQCDFLSIGTNDLVQYTLGIDRDHPAMSALCTPAHPSIIRMIKMVALQAGKEGKPLTICGEMASNPVFVPLLIGLGVNQISCSPRYIPLVKQAVRSVTLLSAYELADKVQTLDTSEAVMQALVEFENREAGYTQGT